MEPINYFLALMAAFSGLMAGIFLAFFAKEEIELGGKYLIMLQKALLMIIVVVFLNLLEIQIVYRIMFYFILLPFLLFINLKSEIVYFILGAIFFLSSQKAEMFLLVSGLILLYGFPTGSLAVKDFNKKLKEAFRITIRNMSFILIGAVLFLLYKMILY